jgi:anion-transporting  ArsA/GET3 family ATPase
LLLVTGKGGVGKTTIAAALARTAHQGGGRVLIAEVTPEVSSPSPLLALFGVSSLANSWEEPIGLGRGLWGVRLAPAIGHRLFLRSALKVRILVDAAMRSAALTRFLMAAPTFPEIGVLYQLVALLRTRAYDHVIVDLPATGHALALASLPRTVHRIVPSGLIGDAIKEGLETMTDPERTATVVVTLPESMPVTEATDLIESLGRYQIPVGAAVLNRMPPDPFAVPERAALDELISDGASVLGTRELRRLSRAIVARENFHRAIPPGIPRYEVPLFMSDEDRLVEEVAQVLKRGPASASPPPARSAVLRTSVPPPPPEGAT